jgi:hypothetical protein
MSRLSVLLRRLPRAWSQPRSCIPEGPPILCLHMPKTAGTSLRRMLQASLGMNAVYPSDEDLRRRPNGHYPSEAELLDPRGRLPRYRVLTGHFSASFAEHLSAPHRRAVVLRDPVQRSLSALAHFHRTRGLPPHQLLDDAVFVENHIRNRQTAILGKEYGEQKAGCSSRHLTKALTNIDAFDFVGLTEHFAESCELFDAVFGTKIRSVILKENVLRPQGTEFNELVPRILPLVQLDRRLYEHATARFRLQSRGAWSHLAHVPRRAA